MGAIDVLFAVDFEVLDTRDIKLERAFLDHVSDAKAVIDHLAPTVAIKVFRRELGG